MYFVLRSEERSLATTIYEFIPSCPGTRLNPLLTGIGECVRLGVMRKVITGIFEEKKFTLQLIFQSYFRIYITFFFFFKEF